MNEKKCNNECGNSYCCTTDCKEVFLVRHTGVKEIELCLTRGYRIYLYETQSKELALLIEIDTICPHLTQTGCDLPRKQRPYYCTYYPTKDHHFLTKKCKFYNKQKHYAYENMRQIKTIKDFKQIKKGD